MAQSHWTDYASAIGSVATAAALGVAIVTAWFTWGGSRYAARQTELFAGAQAAIAWRTEVFALHERGLSPGQIRFIMHLEDGGAGYEGWYGRIDDLVANLPPAPVAGNPGAGQSCPSMPTARRAGSPGGCTGPCRQALIDSGCETFRKDDRDGVRRG